MPMHTVSHSLPARPLPTRCDPLPSAALAESIEPMGARMAFARTSEIYGEGEAADYLYKVVSGTVCTYKVLVDGRRQVSGFYLAGEVFGLEMGHEHGFSAEAITDATVLVIRRSAVLALAERDGDVARQLLDLTVSELVRNQSRVLLLIKSAQERVAEFLLEMSKRCRRGNAIDLPMTRQDIADYLGLTIETVSRTLTAFQNFAMIELPSSRQIVLRDRDGLEDLSACGGEFALARGAIPARMAARGH